MASDHDALSERLVESCYLLGADSSVFEHTGDGTGAC